ncbi:hypothetical protein T484DRAFT_1761516, partial [Baffinella frigidus]
LFVQNCNREKPTKELKLKTSRELTLVLGESRKLTNKLKLQLETAEAGSEEEKETQAMLSKMNQMCSVLEKMCSVLEKGGKFSGINRKLQIKPTKWDPDTSEGAAPGAVIIQEKWDPDTSEGAAPGAVIIQEVVVVLKWGANLTT